MIRAKEITKRFQTGENTYLTALSDVSFEIPDGQTVIISGSNGSGKSLLMKILAGLEKPTSGSVTRTGSIGLVIQDADAQILGDTVYEDVAFALDRKEKHRALEALSRTGLSEKKDYQTHTLSGGEKRRLAIASTIALGRKTVIMDEPYSNLDYPGTVSVNNLILEMRKQGLTIIILSHELDRCLGLCDRFMVLHEGKLVFDGKPQQALETDLSEWGIRNPDVKDIGRLVWL